MNSSAAPTPVMPNTAIAMPMPDGGSSNRRPPATALHEKKRGMRISTTAASAVMHGEQADLDHRDALDARVASAEQQRQCEREKDERPTP